MDNVLNEAKRMASKTGIESQYAYFDKDGQFSFQTRRSKVKNSSADQSVRSFQQSINRSVQNSFSTLPRPLSIQPSEKIQNYKSSLPGKKKEVCNIEDDEEHAENIEVNFLS